MSLQPNFTALISPSAIQALNRIAEALNYRQIHGPGAGQGSVSAPVSALAAAASPARFRVIVKQQEV